MIAALPYLAAHALTVLTTLASIVITLRLLGSRRSAQSTIAWLLALVFAPFVAIPLYLAFGSRKFPRRAKTASPVALDGSAAFSCIGEAAETLGREE